MCTSIADHNDPRLCQKSNFFHAVSQVNSFSSNSLPAIPTLSRRSLHANSRETASEDGEGDLAAVLNNLFIAGHQLGPHPSRRRHRHEPRHRPATLGDHDLLAVLPDFIEQVKAFRLEL